MRSAKVYLADPRSEISLKGALQLKSMNLRALRDSLNQACCINRNSNSLSLRSAGECWQTSGSVEGQEPDPTGKPKSIVQVKNFRIVTAGNFLLHSPNSAHLAS